MAKETVQAIKNAELSAVQAERDADIRKEDILSNARQSAKDLITSMTKDAREKTLHDKDAADKKSEKIMEVSKLKAEKEIADLKNKVKGKEQGAIDMVLSVVI